MKGRDLHNCPQPKFSAGKRRHHGFGGRLGELGLNFPGGQPVAAGLGEGRCEGSGEGEQQAWKAKWRSVHSASRTHWPGFRNRPPPAGTAAEHRGSGGDQPSRPNPGPGPSLRPARCRPTLCAPSDASWEAAIGPWLLGRRDFPFMLHTIGLNLVRDGILPFARGKRLFGLRRLLELLLLAIGFWSPWDYECFCVQTYFRQLNIMFFKIRF